MEPVKKFLSPTLYPLNRVIDKTIKQQWFIKYYEEDFNAGGFKPCKYYGMLNNLPTVEERIKLAAHYMQLMRSGQRLPSHQGQKNMTTGTAQTINTNVIVCCKKFVAGKEIEGIRTSTIQHYRSKVKMFETWLHTQGKQNLAIGAIDKETATDFLLHLKQRGLSNSSFNDYRTLLGSIWNEYADRIQRNPWREIKAARNTVQHLKSYPVDLQQKINETLPAHNKQLWLFMQFVYYTAIRPHSELRFLQVKHINFTTGVITVPAAISKNHKARTINMFTKFVDQLKAENYHTYPADYFLFGLDAAPGAKPVSKNYFGIRWSNYRQAQNIPACYKLYGSKHTGGKNLTKKTNAYITKEHFGHGSLSVTENYIDDLDKNELKFLQVDYPEFAG
jgi:integrase